MAKVVHSKTPTFLKNPPAGLAKLPILSTFLTDQREVIFSPDITHFSLLIINDCPSFVRCTFVVPSLSLCFLNYYSGAIASHFGVTTDS